MIIPVPYISQWEWDATRFKDDCGPTCVAMLLKWRNKLGPLTIDSLAEETSLREKDSGLSPQDLVSLASVHTLTLTVHLKTSLDDIKKELDNGRPVICLIAYRFIHKREDQADSTPGKDGHYVLAVGYEGDEIFLNDPDWYGARVGEGHYFKVPVAQLDAALEGIGYSRSCVYLEDKMSDNDFLKHISDELTGINAEIQAQMAPVTPPLPPPTGSVERVTKTATNVRPVPSTNSTPVGVLPPSTTVNVVDSGINANSHEWFQLANGAYEGKYVAGDQLIPKT